MKPTNADHSDALGLRNELEARIQQLRIQNRALRVLLAVTVSFGALATLSSLRPTPTRAQVEKGGAFKFTHKVNKDTPYYRRLEAAEKERGVLKDGSQVKAEVAGGKARIWIEGEVNSSSLDPL
jgi:hypothetical protein